MVMSCSALGCRNRFTKKSKQLSGNQLTFHKFPSDNPMFPEKVALRQLWHTACKRPNWIAPKRAVLCSEHFQPTDFYRFGTVVKLRENVVPSIFKAVPSNAQLQKKPKSTKKSPSKNRVAPLPMETQPTIETTSSLDLSTCSGASLLNQPYNTLTQAFRSPSFSMMQGNNAICTLKTEFMAVDENILRSLTSTDLPNQTYQFYTTPTCSTNFDPTRNDLQCLPSPTLIPKCASPTPKDPSEELRKTKLKLEDARKKIKTMSEKLRRQEARLKSFDHHANELKYEAQDAAEILSRNLPEGAKQLLKRLAIKSDITTSEEAAYNEDLRAFAMTLYSISPRSYEFVRDSFNKALPSTSRIRQWKHEGTVAPLPLEPIQITPLVNVSAPSTILHSTHTAGLYVVEQRAAVENLLEEL